MGPKNPDIESMKERAATLQKESQFFSGVIELARTLPGSQPQFEGDLIDEAQWRNAWLTPAHFTRPKMSGLPVADPGSLLLNLEPQQRKEFLLMYLRENFPGNIGSPGFRSLEAAIPADLATPRMQKNIHEFIELGKAMKNETANITGTSFATPAALDTGARFALTKRYIGPGGTITHEATEDFERAAARFPAMASGTGLDQAKLKLLLAADTSFFAGAAHYDVFTDAQIQEMVALYETKKQEQRQALETSRLSQRDARNKVESYQDRNFVDRIQENFGKLEGWQQLVVIGVGGFLAFKALFSKEKTGFQRYVLTPVLAIAGFYVLGGRDLVRNTSLDPAFKFVEDYAHKGMKSLEQVGGKTELSAEHLQTYAKYFSEVADKKLAEEVEAMDYISQIPVSAVAESFALSGDGRGPGLDLSKQSALSRNIDKLFTDAGVARNVKSKLMMHNAKLSEAMVHVFYMLGALEKPSQHKTVEDARGDRSFDDLAVGSPEHRTYLALAQDGIQLAQTKYVNSNWYQVVETLLNSGTR